MSRDSSPPPMSDDSAIGSLANGLSSSVPGNNGPRLSQTGSSFSTNAFVNNAPRSQLEAPVRTYSKSSSGSINTNDDNGNGSRPKTSNVLVRPEELRGAALRMRYDNTTLLSRSIRTNLSCFNDLDVNKIDDRPKFMVNFISLGINQNPFAIQRPVSILWPDSYDKMIDALAQLDAMLINTEFKEKPLDWMLARGLTTIPTCTFCKNQMTVYYDTKTVSWRCQRTQACQNLYFPIQRPIFFKGYESVGLLKLLFSIYYWSICTQSDLLYEHLKLEPQTLHGIWRGVQNICRHALENAYPKFKLCNILETNESRDIRQITESSALIDLISIKLNNYFIVCAKQPQSNCVKLGLMIPKVSEYSFAQLTKEWFAHGAQIRICEDKFEDLLKLRTDMQITVCTRTEMVSTKDGTFNHDSAFGYIVRQLAHIFKDFDSSSITLEDLKLILAEIEWREQFGTTPHDAFTNIIKHMALYRNSADCYYEPKPLGETIDVLQEISIGDSSDYVFVEKYFYATLQQLDSQGRVIQHYGSRDDFSVTSMPIVQFRCHLCQSSFESLYFSMHIVAHVEKARMENEEAEFKRTKHIKCKHCFRKFKKSVITDHCMLFRADYHTIKYGCRICCIKYNDRLKYVEHMRRTHFEHEMPYRCPSCKYASSFQRDLIIHFQEEHQYDYTILCPFCLRSFTVAEPAKLDRTRMNQVSQTIFNHIMEHYALADSFSCGNCCLSFLSRAKLAKHKALHHNPLEMFCNKSVKFESFIVTRTEEPHCVQALPTELFIPNKRPNLAIDEASQAATASSGVLNSNVAATKKSKFTVEKSSHDWSSSSSSDDDDDDDDTDDDVEDDDRDTAVGIIHFDGETLHVRPSNRVAKKFLAGGSGSLHLPKTKSSLNNLTTEKISEFMSKLKRADCIIPNQSVILTPSGRPARCVECMELITTDHYVAAITCKPCSYITHCPRAATKHNQTRHSSSITITTTTTTTTTTNKRSNDAQV